MSVRRADLRKIKKFWDEQAAKFESSAKASMPDELLHDLEIEQVIARIQEGSKVLDVGCANGYTTLRLARSKRITIKGVDYSEAMIKMANEELRRWGPEVKKTVSFDVGDVLELQEDEASYDQLVCKRVLINLVAWENQKRALENLHRVLKRGGTLLLSEASKQGWENMNRLRKAFYLEEIPMPWHNLYLDEEQLFAFAAPLFETVEVLNFSSTYYVGSRIMQPLILKMFDPERQPEYDSEINRFFSLLPPYGDYGTQKLYVFAKK